LASGAIHPKKDASLRRSLVLGSSYFRFNFYDDCCISLGEEYMTFLEKKLPFLGMKKAERTLYWNGSLPSGLMLTASSLVVNFSWEIIVDNDYNVG